MPSHPMLAATAAIGSALDEVAGVQPLFLRPAEKQAAILALTRMETRIAAAKLRILAVAADVAEEASGRSRGLGHDPGVAARTVTRSRHGLAQRLARLDHREAGRAPRGVRMGSCARRPSRSTPAGPRRSTT